MFWPFLAATAVGIGFFKLGVLSVWVSVLSVIIQILIVALIGLAAFTIWQRYGVPKQ
jgi:hypothetical protein